jgi:hypothetical protein
MGCIKIDVFPELDFESEMFGKSLLGYIADDELEQNIEIDVKDIIAYEWAPILKVDTETKKNVRDIAPNGIRLLLLTGESLVAPDHCYETFGKLVEMVRRPHANVVTAKRLSLKEAGRLSYIPECFRSSR